MFTHSISRPTRELIFTCVFIFLFSSGISQGQQKTALQISDLINQLKSKEIGVSDKAAGTLCHLGPSAVPYLIDALNNKDPDIRSKAARILGDIGPAAKEATPNLIEVLRDKDEYVRASAVYAIKQMGLEVKVVIPLLISVFRDEGYYVRGKAADALAEIGPAVIPYLIEALKDKDSNIRQYAARTLGQVGPKATVAVPNLIDALRDEDDDVRMYAAEALGKMGPEARAAIPNLINAQGDGYEGVRGEAVRALKQIGPESIPFLIAALKDKDTTVGAISIDALGDIGPEAQAAIPNLIELLHDQSKDIRGRAAHALGSIGSKAIPPLIETLKDKNPNARSSAAFAFYWMGRPAHAAIPYLIEALNDTDSEVRRKAAEALGKMETKAVEAVPKLTELLKDKDGQVRRTAAEALGKIGVEAKSAIPYLIEVLEDKDAGQEAARALSTIALGEMDSDAKASIPKLIKALESENQVIRGSAVGTLGRMGPEAKDAIPALVQLLEDKDDDIRNRAADAIANISLALSKARSSDSLDVLREAHNALLESEDPKVREHAERVKQSIDYLELLWWNRVTNWVHDHPWISLILTIYPLLALILFGLLLAKPLWLFHANEAVSRITDIEMPNWLGRVRLPLRHVMLIGFFHYHPRVLDAWVSKHVKGAWKNFSGKASVRDRDIYVPVPVVLNDEPVPNLTADKLRPTFHRNQARLLIWGEGGSGKTSLAYLLAKWALVKEREERLCSNHLMLPIVIEQDLEFLTNDKDSPFLKVIRDQLRGLIDEIDSPSTELLKHLLKRRRLLVIIDGLSELNEDSRTEILAGIREFANATIITSRADESLNDLPKSTIKPLRIKRDRLSTFMEAYLADRGKRDLFEDDEFFDSCRRLSLMVGDRDITVLLAKLYAEQIITVKEEATEEDLPQNIPDLMLQYVNNIYGKPTSGIPEIRTVHRAAGAVAWECLKKTYRPVSAKREDVLAALGGEENAHLIRYLEETLKLIQTVGVGKDRIRFALDPLSEYLAGLHLINEYGVSEELWKTFLVRADEQEGAPDSIKGFLLAVRDCCLAKGADVPVPSFVADELAKRAGLNPVNKKKLRLERRVKTLVRDLSLPDAEDRADAAKELKDLYKEKQPAYFPMPLAEDIKPDAKIVVPALIRALKDPDSSVRSNVVDVLIEIGSEAKAAVPALIEALKDQYRGVRAGAVLALGKIGPEAKDAVPALIEALNDPDTCVNAAGVFGSIGPDAAAAAPALIAALEDMNEGVRTNAASALINIRPDPATAVPALIKVLNDQSKSVRMNAATALWRMGPEAKEAVPALIQLLNDEDIEVRKIAARAIASTGLNTETVISALTALLKDQDKHLRGIAVFALGKIGLAAVPSLKLAAQDQAHEVRAEALRALKNIGTTI